MVVELSSPAQRRAVQAVACSGVVVVLAAVSTTYIAAPQIGRDLHASQSQLQWIVDAYTVVLASLLLFAGALSDRYGRKEAFLVGLAIFGGASLVAAEAQSATVLIGARVGMGIGAALLLPVTLSLMTTSFPSEHRSRATTAWALSFAVGGLIGIILSGLLLSAWWWGSLFVFNALFSAVCFMVAVVVLPRQAREASVPLDPGGFVLATVAIGTIVYAVIEAPTHGWLATLTILSLIAGGLYTLVFIGYECLVPTPMLDPRIFTYRSVAAGTFVIGFQFLTAFGFPFVYVQFLQYLRGYSPVEAGLSLAPSALSMIVGAAAAHKVFSRDSLRAGGTLGLLLLAAAWALFATARISSPYYIQLLVAQCLIGLGIGLSTSLATTAITEGLPRAQQGVASALNDTIREVGTALGVAICGSILNSAYRNSLEHSHALRQLSPTAARLALNSVGAATQMGSGSAKTSLQATVNSAFMHGLAVSSLVLAVAMAGGALAVAVVTPSHRRSIRAAARRTNRIDSHGAYASALKWAATTTGSASGSMPVRLRAFWQTIANSKPPDEH